MLLWESNAFCRKKKKKILHVKQEIEYERAYFYCKSCNKSYVPFDSFFSLEHKEYTPEYALMIAHFVGLTVSFTDSHKTLGYSCHPVCSQTLIQKIAQEVGQTGINEENNLYNQGLPEANLIGMSIKDNDSVFTTEIDGGRCKVWQNIEKLGNSEWKEVKTGAFCEYQQEIDKDGKQTVKPISVESIGRVDESYEVFGLRLYLEAVRRGYNKRKRKVFLCDGARANWEIWKMYFHESIPILDWYHAVEHLSLIAKLIFGEKSELWQEWFGTIKDILYSGNWVLLLEKIDSHLNGMKTSEIKKSLERERNYFYSNRERINYAEHEKNGIPIGSGAIESRIKTTVNRRLKGTEKHWRKLRADNILYIRMAEVNDGMQKLSQFYLKAA